MKNIQRVLGRFSLVTKLSFVALPIVCVLLVLLSQYLSTINGLINATAYELEGADYIKPQMELIEKLQIHRGLANIELGGDSSVRPRREAVAQEVQQKFQFLLDKLPASWLETRSQLSQEQKTWASLSLSAGGVSPKESFAAHSRLIMSIINTIRLAADESTMTFDPAAGTYYLVSAANFQMPQVLENLGQMRGSISSMVSKGEIDPYTVGVVNTLLNSTKFMGMEIEDSLRKAEAADVNVQPELKQQAAQFNDVLDKMSTLVSQMEQNTGSLTGEQVYNEFTKHIAALSAYQDNILVALKVALADRLNQQQIALYSTLSAVTLIGAVAVVLSYLIFLSIKESIRTMTNQTVALAAGDLTRKQLVETRDEFGVVSSDLERVRIEQSKILGGLKNTAENLLQSCTVMNTATGQVMVGASEQADAASSVASSVEELTVSVSQVSEFAGQAHRLAIQAGESSSEGQKRVGATLEAMSDISKSSAALAARIESLGQRSEGISSIIQSIQGIASQTNLLALNAAIEAARAGEQGRGFAVVADEVRLLSEKTAESTRNIADLIFGIQSDTKDAVSQVGSWGEKVERSLSDSVIADSTMKKIGSDSVETEHAVDEISVALVEQSSAANLIAQKVEHIAQMTEDSRAASEKVNRVSSDLSAVATQLGEMIGRFKLDHSANRSQ